MIFVYVLSLPLPGELQNSLLTPLLADTASLASFFTSHIFTVQVIVPIFSTQQTFEFFHKQVYFITQFSSDISTGDFLQKTYL